MQNPKFSKYYRSGYVCLEKLQELPSILHDLLLSIDFKNQDFKTNIRWYNAALVFISIICQSDQRIDQNNLGVYVLQIYKKLFYLQGPLNPTTTSNP